MNVMTLFKNLSMEYKASLLFALCALVVSLILGAVFGIGAGTVFMRSLILTIVFAGLGFGVIAVLKRYVPELYSLLNEMNAAPARAEGADEADANARDEAKAKNAEGPAEESEGENSGKTFNELSDEDFTKLTSNVDGAGSDRKMGKHIIANEKIVSYEPKIMAQAVRTMMRRDED
jgi:hypothetical protein